MASDARSLLENVRALVSEDTAAIAAALDALPPGRPPPDPLLERLAKATGAVQYAKRKATEAGLDAVECFTWLAKLLPLWESAVSRRREALIQEHFTPLKGQLNPAPRMTGRDRLAHLARVRAALDRGQDAVRALAAWLDSLLEQNRAAEAGFPQAAARLRAELALQADAVRQHLRKELAERLEEAGTQRLAEVTTARDAHAYAWPPDGLPPEKPVEVLAALLAELELTEQAAARGAKLALAAGLPNVPGLDALDKAKDILREGLTGYRQWCSDLQRQHVAFGPGPDPLALLSLLQRGTLASDAPLTGAFGLDSRQGPYWLVYPFEEAVRRNVIAFLPAAPPATLPGLLISSPDRPAARLPLDGCRLLFAGLRQERICGECDNPLPWAELLDATQQPRPFDEAVRGILGRPCCQERVLRHVKCPVCTAPILPQTRVAYRGRTAKGLAPSAALREMAGSPCCGIMLLTFEDLQAEVEHQGFPGDLRADAREFLAKAMIETRVYDPHPRASRAFGDETPFTGLPAFQRPEVYIVPLGRQDAAGRPLFKLGAWGELQRLEGLQERLMAGRKELDALFEPAARALLGTKDI